MAIKAKMSFDKARIQQFFLTHGEKVALAVAVLICAYVGYDAMQVEQYNRTTEELKSDVTRGRTALANSHKNHFKPELDDIKLPTKDDGFVDTIKRELLNPLSPVIFAGIEWNKPLFETKLRRKEPEYLALNDLVPVFHHGAIVMKGPGGEAGDTLTRGEEWISVMGLVPFEEQIAKYAGAFKNALDPLTNATPTYRRYEIKRAEVSTMDPNEPLDWQPISPLSLQTAVIDWVAKWPAEGGVESAPANTVSWPPLTEPLPPLPNQDLAGWSVHPVIESEAAAAGAAPVVAAAAAPAAVLQGGNPNDPFGPAPAPAPAPVVAGQPGGAPAPAAQRAKYLLFRFLDFDIEAGKKYRYQVKLVLNNPNYNLDQAHLEKPDMAVGDVREAPWSKPSGPVQVPHLERLYAGYYKSLGGDQEPKVNVGLRWWFPNLAAEGYIKFDEILRGSILNGNVSVAYFTPGKNLPAQTTLPFTSNVLLVDFGWEKLDNAQTSASGRRIQRPSEVLMLNPRGELKIALQTMDSHFWATQKAAAVVGGAAVPGGALPGEGAPAAQPGAPPAGGRPSIFDLN